MAPIRPVGPDAIVSRLSAYFTKRPEVLAVLQDANPATREQIINQLALTVVPTQGAHDQVVEALRIILAPSPDEIEVPSDYDN